MGSILNNLSAMAASRQLTITGQNLQNTITQLTTGKRINTAADDPAGLAIANKLGADIKIAGQAQRNANDGVSYMQVADGALDEVTNLLTRAAQLALGNAHNLHGWLRICAWCHQVEDPDGGWVTFEKYVHRVSTAHFSHGLCPGCADRMVREAESL